MLKKVEGMKSKLTGLKKKKKVDKSKTNTVITMKIKGTQEWKKNTEENIMAERIKINQIYKKKWKKE